MRVPIWWQKYASGQIRSLPQLTAAVEQEKRAMDAPDEAFARFMGEVVDGERPEVVRRLFAPSLMTATETLYQHGIADWQNVNPLVQIFAARLIEYARKRGVPLFVNEAFRSEEAHTVLFEAGLAEEAYPSDPHCLGLAVQIRHCRYGAGLTPDEFKWIGKCGSLVARPLQLHMHHVHGRFFVAGWSEAVRAMPSGRPVRKTPRGILRQYQGYQ